MTTTTPTPITLLPTATPTAVTGGFLGDRLRKNIENLLLAIDVEQFVVAYRDEHDAHHAEPEFAGHYMDAALSAWRATGDERLLQRAGRLAEIIVQYQREDGYLGAYRPGLEFAPTFSVWNEQFSIMALLMYHEATGDAPSLAAARRCADRLVESFRRPGGPELFDAINQGIENSCILIEFVHLYEVTEEPRYLEFAEWIVERWEQGSTRLIGSMESEYAHWGMVACLKGLEIVLCYRGLLRLGLVTGNERYVRAAARYWETLRASAIGPTGNGTIFENWSPAAAVPNELPTELHPNENCVAVGWMQLSSELYAVTGDATYLDEYERTVYNHLIGSQAADGRDFSYYQGNVGVKVHATDPAYYSCCRYRGLTMLTQLPGHVVTQRVDGIAIGLYTDSESRAEANGVPVAIRQRTDYPRSGSVVVEVDPESAVEFALLLRVPQQAPLARLTVNGEPVETESWKGFAEIRRTWSPGDVVEADLAPEVRQQETVLDGRPAVLTTYGSLVLAIDTREGTPLDTTAIGEVEAARLAAEHPVDWSRVVRFTVPGSIGGEARDVALVDYASAGSVEPGVDRFRVWVTRS